MIYVIVILQGRSFTEGWTQQTNTKWWLTRHTWTTGTCADAQSCRHRWSSFLKASPQESEASKEEDWRDVRAKLLQQYYKSESTNQQQQQETSMDAPTNSTMSLATTSNKWAYDSGSIVERGSLIVSHPVQDFACGGLKQQYFHKCVVLVVKHDAHFTKGVILNRCSRSMMPPKNTSNTDTATTPWTMYFAGDVQGWNSLHPDYTCLHRLKSPKALELSLPVVKDVHVRTRSLRKKPRHEI